MLFFLQLTGLNEKISSILLKSNMDNKLIYHGQTVNSKESDKINTLLLCRESFEMPCLLSNCCSFSFELKVAVWGKKRISPQLNFGTLNEPFGPVCISQRLHSSHVF